MTSMINNDKNRNSGVDLILTAYKVIDYVSIYIITIISIKAIIHFYYIGDYVDLIVNSIFWSLGIYIYYLAFKKIIDLISSENIVFLIALTLLIIGFLLSINFLIYLYGLPLSAL
jgi:hypothetical protein